MKTKIHIRCHLIPSYKVVLSSLSPLFLKKQFWGVAGQLASTTLMVKPVQ